MVSVIILDAGREVKEGTLKGLPFSRLLARAFMTAVFSSVSF